MYATGSMAAHFTLDVALMENARIVKQYLLKYYTLVLSNLVKQSTSIDLLEP